MDQEEGWGLRGKKMTRRGEGSGQEEEREADAGHVRSQSIRGIPVSLLVQTKFPLDEDK